MSKSNKELVVDLTIAYINSWNAKERTSAIQMDQAIGIFNSFKTLVESMDNAETE